MAVDSNVVGNHTSVQTPNVSVLVLGAGELGMAILRSLADQKASSSDRMLTVLLRPAGPLSENPKKAQQLEELTSLGVNFVFADLVDNSIAELASLFGRFDIVISCTGFVAGRHIQVKLARAVLEGKVKRYVPWQFGVDYDTIGRGSAQDLFDEQLDVRNLLRSQQGTEWVIISTGMFTSFLFEPSFGVVNLAENTVHALGSWETAVTVTTPSDIGTITREVLFAKPRIVNQIVYTAGDTITYAQLADMLDLVIERPIKRIEWSVPMLKEQLAQDPGNQMRKYRVVFAEGRGVAWPVGNTFNQEQGIPMMGAEQWLREHLTDMSSFR